MIVSTLTAAHLSQIRPQAAQSFEAGLQGLAVPPGQGWAAVVAGQTMAAAGLIELWPGRAYAWALLDHDAGRHLLGITRAIRSCLDAACLRRIEMAVDAEFKQGARFAELLGFHLESRARAYFPNGNDGLVYVRIQ